MIDGTRLQHAGLVCVGLGTLLLLGSADPLVAIGGMLLLLAGVALLWGTDSSFENSGGHRGGSDGE